MSFLFATSEVLSKQDRPAARGGQKPRVFRNPVLFWIHASCALVILAAGAWAFAGAGIWELTPLYIGEVASIWAFGISWIIAGTDRTAPARVRLAQAQGQAVPPDAALPVSSRVP